MNRQYDEEGAKLTRLPETMGVHRPVVVSTGLAAETTVPNFVTDSDTQIVTERRGTRALALAVVLANIAFNYASEHVAFGHGSMKAISERYANLFTPAGYAFAMWGIIYASFLGYCCAQFLPDARRKPVYEFLNPIVIVVNVLLSAWIIAFRYEQLWLSVGIIFAALACAIFLYASSYSLKDRVSFFTLPFSLLLAWLSVATIAATAAALVGAGWQGGSAGPTPYALGMIICAATIGIAIGCYLVDGIFPAVVAWGMFAIYVRVHVANTLVGNVALGAAITCALCAITIGIIHVQALRITARHDAVFRT